MRTEHEKFLNKSCRQFPALAETFNRYSAFSPEERIAAVRAEARIAPRRLWRDLGIPANQSETLYGHATGMLNLLKNHGSFGYDVREVKNLISVWAGPRVLAGEIPLNEMSGEDRKILRAAAAELVYETDYFKIGRSEVLNEPGAEEPDESAFVNDLDFIRTAMEAQCYKNTHPHLMTELNVIVEGCHNSLTTLAGAEIWKKALAPGMPLITIRGANREAANDGVPVAFRLVSGSDIRPANP